jgi:ribosomal protein S17E
MGKIKSKLIKRSAENFVKKGIEFNEDFAHNKKILGSTMPSKKLRNQMAGYLARLKKKERIKQEEFASLLAKRA